jgi:uncharacterized protein
MTRGQFLRTAAATVTAFWVLERVFGTENSAEAAMPISHEQMDDLDAARELLDEPYFVMDVQTHHVDLDLPNAAFFCGVRLGERFTDLGKPCADKLPLLGQANFMKELFLDSETDVAVISGIPSGVALPPDSMAQTRDLVNAMAGSPRALSQAMIDPKARPGTATALDSLDHQVQTLGAKGLKCYTYNGDWWLDDERVSYPMLEAASARGIDVINCHKGLPNLTFFPNSGEYVRTRDLPKAVRDWPQLKFCAYHAGYFPAERGNREFLRVAKSLERRHRRNLYAEIGSSFALALLDGGPRHAALFVGKLLRVLGSRNVLWGTDSIWWGSPQWLIDAFKMLRIPNDLRERYRLPALTRKVKARVLGLNAARLYGVDPGARAAALATDWFARVREAQGGHRVERSLRTYGPRTRRQFLTLLRRGAAFV